MKALQLQEFGVFRKEQMEVGLSQALHQVATLRKVTEVAARKAAKPAQSHLLLMLVQYQVEREGTV